MRGDHHRRRVSVFCGAFRYADEAVVRMGRTFLSVCLDVVLPARRDPDGGDIGVKRWIVHCLLTRLVLASCIVAVLCLPLVAHGSPAALDSVLHCMVLDEARWDDAPVAGKRASELNVGEPRTVRMIYFLPSDRPYRQSVVDRMKARMVRMQRLFGEQMESHGYGYMTFRYEADAAGNPVVHRLDGEHTRGYYNVYSWERMGEEVYEVFDRTHVVLFVVLDRGYGTRIGVGRRDRVAGLASGDKDGGRVLVPAGFSFFTGVHEIAHGFGLVWHDYRDVEYILSFGRGVRMSACSAAYLSMSPYFNPDVPLKIELTARRPALELLSPGYYEAGTESLTIRLGIAAPHGLHQLIAKAPTPGTLSWEVLGCRLFSGEEEAEIEYEYDGVPYDGRTLSNPPAHSILFTAVDRRGNREPEVFRFAQRSPYHLATLEGHTDAAYRVAISPEGATLASGSRDGTVRLWDTKTLEEIATLEMSGRKNQITSLAFSPDGSLLAVGVLERGVIALWDVASRRLAGTLEGHTRWNTTLAFSPDGGRLVSGSLGGEDNIKVWDVASWQLLGELRGHTESVRQVAFSPDGRTLASCSTDRTIRIWDLAALKERYRLVRIGGGSISSIAFSPDGRILAADATMEGLIVLWDWAAQRNIADVPMVHDTGIGYLTFSPDGESLASRGGLQAIVRDVATGKARQRFKVRQTFPHTAGVGSLAYWPDGSVLGVGTYDNRIELWDTSEWVRRRPDRVEVVSGFGQRGVAGTVLPAPFVVSVRDQNGDPFPGIPVLFAVTEGGGVVSTTAARADTSGRAATTLTLGTTPGMHTVVARAADLEPAVITATAHGRPDLNADGAVDFEDFVLFAQKFGRESDDDGYDARFDLDGDGAIGFSDFLIFANAFGQGA